MLKVKKSWIGMFIWEVRELLDNNTKKNGLISVFQT